ncbi:MAG: SDR family oxidoreductase [Colwellia sp.]|jgi:Nucleoside-diphosphate-sugar epimerases
MTSSQSVLLTGATGFVGSAILNKLESDTVSLLGRNKPVNFIGSYFQCEIAGDVDYHICLKGIDVVIHSAARVHVMSEHSYDPLGEYRKINTTGSLNLARQAAKAGVKRFIFISSIKVNGESTIVGDKFTIQDQLKPEDPYGISKAEAEMGLLNIAKETGMEVVVIRPPLIYGPGVKGNFLNLLKIAKSGLPLPLGAIYNARSMVYIENLTSLIILCINHREAANRVFLASDGEDLSTTRLLEIIRRSMNKPVWLFPVPAFIYSMLGRVTGKTAILARLTGSLQVDSSDSKKYLEWEPPYTVEEGLMVTVDSYLKNL